MITYVKVTRKQFKGAVSMFSVTVKVHLKPRKNMPQENTDIYQFWNGVEETG